MGGYYQAESGFCSMVYEGMAAFISKWNND
jgi:hypothetical protein